MHGVAYTPLQRAAPDRRIVSAAALVVALEPLADFAELHEIRRIWLYEKHEFDDSLPKLYQEIV